MTTLSKMLSALTIFLIAVPLALTQGTYTQIDVPGATRTFAIGINNVSDISGWYVNFDGTYHGFLLSGGTYTTIDYPGSSATELYGMNDLGQFVGYTGTATVGFEYDSKTQEFTNIAYPGASSTLPGVINNAGAVGGYFFDGTGNLFGFELAGSTYRRIAPGMALGCEVTGITGSGNVAGVCDPHENFLLAQGKYQQLRIPGLPGTTVTGISPSGAALVGWYQPSSAIYDGFVYQNNTVQTLQFAGSNETFPTGVNNSGEVVGLFYDSSGFSHGFTWTPPAPVEKK